MDGWVDKQTDRPIQSTGIKIDTNKSMKVHISIHKKVSICIYIHMYV